MNMPEDIPPSGIFFMEEIILKATTEFILICFAAVAGLLILAALYEHFFC